MALIENPLLKLFCIVTLLSAYGCVALQPFPHAARAGDSVTLAVGSVEGMTTTNTTITFTSVADPLNPVDLSGAIKSVFKAYPDKRSRLAVDSAARNIPQQSGHAMWVTMVALDLPPGLPTGPATLQIATPATGPVNTTSVNSVTIDFEILPGTGQPNPLQYLHNQLQAGNLTDLEPAPQVELRPAYDPANPGVWPLFGAVEINWDVPMQTDQGGAVVDQDIRLVTGDMEAATGSQLRAVWARTGSSFRVALVSTRGMQAYEPRIAIALRQGNQFIGDPSVVPTVQYFDVSGNPVSGPSMTVWKNGVQVFSLP